MSESVCTMQVQYAAWRQYQPHHTNTIPPYSHVPHNRVHRTALRRPSHSRPVPAPPPVRRTHRLFPLTKRLSAHALRFAQVSSPPTRHRIGVLSLAMSPHSASSASVRPLTAMCLQSAPGPATSTRHQLRYPWRVRHSAQHSHQYPLHVPGTRDTRWYPVQGLEPVHRQGSTRPSCACACSTV